MEDQSRQDRREKQRPPRRRTRSRSFTLFSLAALAGLWAWALAWTLSGASWIVDVLANLAAQGLIVTACAAIVWCLLRRRVLFALAVIACGMHIWIIGTGRAALTPRGLDPSARMPGAVRMLHYNASHKRPPEDVYAMLAAAAPDLASITEPNVPLQYAVLYGDGLESEYPYRLKRHFRERGPEDRVGAGIVLSRWPLAPYPVESVVHGEIAEDFIAGVLTIPAAAIGSVADARWGIIAIHPRSPRNAARWAHGHEVVRACAGLSRAMQAEGLPVVVLADLNSTPSGWRSRELFFEGGLRRAKPLLSPGGTYPSRVDLGGRGVPMRWPGTVAIDDAFISAGMAVRGWTRLDPAESDHWPILVELVPTGP